jgi:Cu-processing system ATP-binding protein
MPQLTRFPDNLTVKELFSLLEDVRRSGDSDRTAERDTELFDRYRLRSIARRRVRDLSGGTRQKINAAIAFLFAPRVLILDEPTVGLDPLAASVFKDKIHALRKAGKTIVLISHLPGEIEELADHIVYMLEGKPYFDGSVKELLEKKSESGLERAIARLMEESDESAHGKDTDVRNS